MKNRAKKGIFTLALTFVLALVLTMGMNDAALYADEFSTDVEPAVSDGGGYESGDDYGGGDDYGDDGGGSDSDEQMTPRQGMDERPGQEQNSGNGGDAGPDIAIMQGEDGDIILITSADDLLRLADAINSGGFVQNYDKAISDAKMRLENDIDLSGIQFTPIGNEEHAFRGEFDGNGFTISNLTIDRGSDAPESGLAEPAGIGDTGGMDESSDGESIDELGEDDLLGLFGVLGVGGKVHDLRLSGVRISGGAFIGGIAGVAEFAEISDCEVDGDISAYDAIAGGIAGFAYETVVERCNTSGSVNGGVENAGGIAGYAALDGCAIRQCSSSATITVLWGAGGIAGGAANAEISDCDFSGELVCNSIAVGNMVGDVSVEEVTEEAAPTYEVDAENDTNEMQLDYVPLDSRQTGGGAGQYPDGESEVNADE